jgi:Zn-dependent peptidase ImmA (M78 family)
MAMFEPSRLELARQRRGLTKVKLARLTGLDVVTISRYESGKLEPTAGSVERLAYALDFPIEFFGRDEVEPLLADNASFRAMKAMTARQRDAALGAGAIAIELMEWVQGRFRLQSPDIPGGDRLSPEVAANVTRAQWNLGEKPISNMVHLLEYHGVRVFSLAEDCVEVNAFSLWREGTPFVFLNTMKSSEKSRFDAAHELGHLILHREGEKGRDVEREADQFASSFLMPVGSITASAPRNPTIPSLIQAKRYWNVSLAALVHRMREVEILSEWHYRTLFVTLSELGYRRKEPNSAPRETSQVWTKVFAALRQEGISKSDVARELRLPVRELEGVIFGLVKMGSIAGGGRGGGIGPRATLRIV